ncbi:MAG: hypothetical protein IPG28_12755 [Betaproteobacteria bacterium]|nr:hypothetical protein [Betaproteobacteria bacterium]
MSTTTAPLTMAERAALASDLAGWITEAGGDIKGEGAPKQGAPPTTKRTAPPTRQEKDMATIVRTQGELDEIDDRGREVVR